MVQFLSINFFSWISSILVGFFKSSRFLCHPVHASLFVLLWNRDMFFYCIFFTGRLHFLVTLRAPTDLSKIRLWGLRSHCHIKIELTLQNVVPWNKTFIVVTTNCVTGVIHKTCNYLLQAKQVTLPTRILSTDS